MIDRLKRVLVATDFSKVSENALDHAALIAVKNNAELHIVHVRAPFPSARLLRNVEAFPDTKPHDEVLQRFARREMEHQEPRFAVKVIKTLIDAADVAMAIVDYADEQKVDLIVVGTHGHGKLADFFLGSVADRVLRHAPVSVLVVGQGASHRLRSVAYGTVLVPVDFSEASKRALQHAALVGEQHQAEVVVIHIIEDVPHPAYYAGDKDSIREAFPDLTRRVGEGLEELLEPFTALKNRVMVEEGRAHRRIAEVAGELGADLIVMGSRGLGGIERFLLGSVTERTIRRAPCPVLADMTEIAVNI